MPKSQLYGMPARYLATPPTLSDGAAVPLLVNSSGALVTTNSNTTPTITSIPNLTSNGLVTTTSGNGTLVVSTFPQDSTVYLDGFGNFTQPATGGWLVGSGTWTYVSATTFTVPSADAAAMAVGDRIKLTQTTAKYFVVVGIASTTITVTAGTTYTLANAAITSPQYSHAASPVGYPAWFDYTPTVTAKTGTFTTVAAVAAFAVVGRSCQYISETTTTTVGTASAATRLTLPISCATGGIIEANVGAGRERFNSGDMLTGRVIDATRVEITNYANAFAGSNNSVQSLSISYQI